MQRGLAKRLALIPLGVVIALCAMEAVLQLGALALRLTGQQQAATWMTGRRRILCVGDSQTYGLYLAERAQAYPQQLEQLWNESVETPRIEVLNIGYPGNNSSGLRRDLPRILQTLRPDAVIIMVGSNDYWTTPAAASDSGNLFSGIVHWFQRHSRAYQLVNVLRRAVDRRKLEVIEQPSTRRGSGSGVVRYGDVEFPMGWTAETGRRDNDQQLQANLRALVDTAREFGTEPLLMTYPSRMWNLGDASRVIRIAAADTGTRLVDLAAVFDPGCPAEPCPDWLHRDHHPTAGGYRLIADALVRELRGAL